MWRNIAHAGHDHSTEAVAQGSISASAEVLLLLALASSLTLFWITARAFKLAMPVRAFIVLTVLLASGIGAYALAPIVSTVSLAAGFALALALAFLPLIARR